MLSLPVGRYVPGKSFLHRLDARVKLLCFFLLVAASVATVTPAGFLLLFAFAALAAALSRLPASVVLGSLLKLWSFFLLLFLMNACFFGGESVWLAIGPLKITREGIAQGMQIVLRVAVLLVLGAVLTGVTAPVQITSGLEFFLKPLRLLRVPVEEVAMILGVAIQFVPTLLEESDAIRKAQIARGAKFESRSLLQRARSVLPLVIPIFLSAFRRADELSMAMEARGYRNARSRTPRENLPMRLSDGLAFLFCAAFALCQILVSGAL